MSARMPARHGDHRVGGFERGLLDPAGDPVAAAELLGLPRTQRLEAVRGDDVRDAVQQLREVPGAVRVPGVRVHEVGAGDVLGDLQIDAEGREGGVRVGELGGHEVGEHVRLVARQRRSSARRLRWSSLARRSATQLGDVHAGTAVDLGRILPGDHVDSHLTDASTARR